VPPPDVFDRATIKAQCTTLRMPMIASQFGTMG
jgi:hypothetical protein